MVTEAGPCHLVTSSPCHLARDEEDQDVYESHFGLVRRPFAETVKPTAYVPLLGHDKVLRRLRYGLEQGRGPAVLFGPPGSGKTLLARRLEGQWPGPTVYVTF